MSLTERLSGRNNPTRIGSLTGSSDTQKFHEPITSSEGRRNTQTPYQGPATRRYSKRTIKSPTRNYVKPEDSAKGICGIKDGGTPQCTLYRELTVPSLTEALANLTEESRQNSGWSRVTNLNIVNRITDALTCQREGAVRSVQVFGCAPMPETGAVSDYDHRCYGVALFNKNGQPIGLWSVPKSEPNKKSNSLPELLERQVYGKRT